MTTTDQEVTQTLEDMRETIRKALRDMIATGEGSGLTPKQSKQAVAKWLFESMTRLIVMAHTRGFRVKDIIHDIFSMEIVVKGEARKISIEPEFAGETERICKKMGLDFAAIKAEIEAEATLEEERDAEALG